MTETNLSSALIKTTAENVFNQGDTTFLDDFITTFKDKITNTNSSIFTVPDLVLRLAKHGKSHETLSIDGNHPNQRRDGNIKDFINMAFHGLGTHYSSNSLGFYNPGGQSGSTSAGQTSMIMTRADTGQASWINTIIPFGSTEKLSLVEFNAQASVSLLGKATSLDMFLYRFAFFVKSIGAAKITTIGDYKQDGTIPAASDDVVKEKVKLLTPLFLDFFKENLNIGSSSNLLTGDFSDLSFSGNSITNSNIDKQLTFYISKKIGEATDIIKFLSDKVEDEGPFSVVNFTVKEATAKKAGAGTTEKLGSFEEEFSKKFPFPNLTGSTTEKDKSFFITFLNLFYQFQIQKKGYFIPSLLKNEWIKAVEDLEALNTHIAGLTTSPGIVPTIDPAIFNNSTTSLTDDKLRLEFLNLYLSQSVNSLTFSDIFFNHSTGSINPKISQQVKGEIQAFFNKMFQFPAEITSEAQAKLFLEIIELLVEMLSAIQNVAAQQAKRLKFLADWQTAYTELMTDVYVFTETNHNFTNLAADAKDKTTKGTRRNNINAANKNFLDNMKTRRGLVSDQAKQFQTNVSQSNDAANEQASIASSLLQQLSGMLATIFR